MALFGLQEEQQPGQSRSLILADTATNTFDFTVIDYKRRRNTVDGEPLASETFRMAGHDWVLLFYPDGKRRVYGSDDNKRKRSGDDDAEQHDEVQDTKEGVQMGEGVQGGESHRQKRQRSSAAPPPLPGGKPKKPSVHNFAELYVAHIGQSSHAEGVTDTATGPVHRAYHSFTLVNQCGNGEDITTGRSRGGPGDQEAVSINLSPPVGIPFNWYGHRRFAPREAIDDPANGYILDDTLLIRYRQEVVITQGGAVRPPSAVQEAKVEMEMAGPTLVSGLEEALRTGRQADVFFTAEGGGVLKAHKIMLKARCLALWQQYCRAVEFSGRNEMAVEPEHWDSFPALLHYIYTGELPRGLLQGVEDLMKLQYAADFYMISHGERGQALQTACEDMLTELIEVDTVIDLHITASKTDNMKLKHACLEFMANNLAAVQKTEGYRSMSEDSSFMTEVLEHIAQRNAPVKLVRGRRQSSRGYGPTESQGPAAEQTAAGTDLQL